MPSQDPAFILCPYLLGKIQVTHDKVSIEVDDDLTVYISVMTSNSVKGSAGQVVKEEVQVVSSWTVGPGDVVENHEDSYDSIK